MREKHFIFKDRKGKITSVATVRDSEGKQSVGSIIIAPAASETVEETDKETVDKEFKRVKDSQ